MRRESSRPQMRRFGLTVALGLTLIGLLSWYRGHTSVPTVLWTIATVLFLFGLIAPNLLVPIQRVWMGLAIALGWVNTRIILSLLFYAVITPTGVVMRFFRDPLDRRLGDGRTSYWVKKDSKPFDPKSYENQF